MDVDEKEKEEIELDIVEEEATLEEVEQEEVKAVEEENGSEAEKKDEEREAEATSEKQEEEVEKAETEYKEEEKGSEIVVEEKDGETEKVEGEQEEKRNLEVLNISVIKEGKINKTVLISSIVAFSVIALAVVLGIVFVNLNREEEVPEEEPVIEEEKKLIVPVYSEESKQRLQDIYVSNGEEKACYLTFDDGPSKNITPQILDILREKEVKATFFVLGSRAELYPELVKQEYDEGHYIANHGYSHSYPNVYETAQSVVDEYYRTESIIVSALDLPEYSSHLFRFPRGK